MPSADPSRRGPMLCDLLAMLPPGVADVRTSPRGLDVPLSQVVIRDPLERVSIDGGEVVLAVGVDSGSSDAVELFSDAGLSGAAAVVLRHHGALSDELLAAADRAGVALLGAPQELGWGQLHALLRTAIIGIGLSAERAPDQPLRDLFSLAMALAASAGGAVSIEDTRSNVLAYANLDEEPDEGRRATILGRRVPERWRTLLEEQGVFRALWATDAVVTVDLGEPLRPRLAVAVRAGDEILGSLWLQLPDGADEDAAATVLREGAPLVALELLRHRAADDLVRARKADVLRAALEARVAPEFLASSLGMPESGAVTLLAIWVPSAAEDDPARSVIQAERTMSSLALSFESYRRQAACVTIGSIVYVLVPHTAGSTRANVIAMADSVRERIGDGGERIRIAVGATVPSLTDLVRSRREADQVLRAQAANPERHPVAGIDDVWSQVVVDQIGRLANDEPALVVGPLGGLVDQDRRRSTRYVETLRAYLDAGGDVQGAAASLDVHPNTFRYRLRRVSETPGLDLDHPVDRLVIHLQLRLMDRGARNSFLTETHSEVGEPAYLKQRQPSS